MVLVVSPIQTLKSPKGTLPTATSKKLSGICRLFKAVYGNAGVLIKLARNAAGNGIQLHTVGFAARHICREQAEEIAGAAGGSKMLPWVKPICARAL